MSESQENQQQSDRSSENSDRQDTLILLRETILRLEKIIAKLDENAVETLPVASIKALVDTTEELAAALEVAETPQVEPTEEKVTLVEVKPSETETPVAEKELETQIDWWRRFLGKIRSLLPAAIGRRLSDLALTGILSAIATTVVLTSVVLLLPQQPTQIEEIVPAPEESSIAEETIPEPEEEITPTPLPTETPPAAEAPTETQPEAETPPQFQLTPEQSLIAAIQEQVAEITNRYAEDLILSIEANFLSSRLIVTVSEDWYQLTSNRQDKIGDEILARSRQLDFKKLEIVDPSGIQLARNPVVGNKTLILKRSAEI